MPKSGDGEKLLWICLSTVLHTTLNVCMYVQSSLHIEDRKESFFLFLRSFVCLCVCLFGRLSDTFGKTNFPKRKKASPSTYIFPFFPFPFFRRCPIYRCWLTIVNYVVIIINNERLANVKLVVAVGGARRRRFDQRIHDSKPLFHRLAEWPGINSVREFPASRRSPGEDSANKLIFA